MNLEMFNRFRRTGVTNTTQALDALYRARPAAVVSALSKTSPFGGLPDPYLTALSRRGLSAEELRHIREWPDKDKKRVRVAVLNAINANRTVHFAWKLHDGSKESTIIRTSGPDPITITFYSPWSNVRAVARDNVTVEVSS